MINISTCSTCANLESTEQKMQIINRTFGAVMHYLDIIKLQESLEAYRYHVKLVNTCAPVNFDAVVHRADAGC